MSKVNFAITARKKELGCESSGGWAPTSHLCSPLAYGSGEPKLNVLWGRTRGIGWLHTRSEAAGPVHAAMQVVWEDLQQEKQSLNFGDANWSGNRTSDTENGPVTTTKYCDWVA
jgi:hypothetical protein